MDMEKIRADFFCLNEGMKNKPIIYFDNTSITLTPKPVLDKIINYYNTPGNLRSAHEFSVNTMIKCDESRKKVSKLINARSSNEIVWTKNATEGINLISKTVDFKAGDVVLTTDKEHNSNLVPWHDLKKIGVTHELVTSKPDNTFDFEKFQEKLNDNVKLVSMCYTSIIDGYTLPAKEVVKLAHEHGALVLLDAVLTVPHRSVDVQELDADFLVFSLSNMCGPNGLGVMYGKEEHLTNLKPFLGGGGANMNISYQNSQYQDPPAKFEAGGQNCASIIGAGVAVEYLNLIGFGNISEHEFKLNKLLTEKLGEIPGVSIVGPSDPEARGGMVNFNIEGLNPHDVAISLEELGNILVRSGNLCAHSYVNEHLKGGAVSVLFYIYNTVEEVEKLVTTLKQLVESFF